MIEFNSYSLTQKILLKSDLAMVYKSMLSKRKLKSAESAEEE